MLTQVQRPPKAKEGHRNLSGTRRPSARSAVLTASATKLHRTRPSSRHEPGSNPVPSWEAAAPLPSDRHAAADAVQPASQSGLAGVRRARPAPTSVQFIEAVAPSPLTARRPRNGTARPPPSKRACQPDGRRETSAHPISYQFSSTGKRLTIPSPSYAPGAARPSQGSNLTRRASAGSS
jgi:hypothetical protein